MEEIRAFGIFCYRHWPYLTTLIAVIIGTIWITRLILNKMAHWKGRVIDAEKECKKIDSHVVPKLNTLDNSINNVDKNITSLISFLTAKHRDLQPNLFIAKSPIQLTQIGVELLELFGGKKYIDENVLYLLSEMEKQSFKSGLDVENFCKVLLIKESSSDNFTPIKNYIFNNPIYKNNDITVQLDLDTVVHIISIYLRNKYFEKHPSLQSTL